MSRSSRNAAADRRRALAGLESDWQTQIVDGLRLAGALVLVTERRAGGRAGGIDKGLPDLGVRFPEWTSGMWLGVEVKRPGGRPSSPEQAALVANGHVLKATKVADLAREILRLEHAPTALPPARPRLASLIGGAP